MPQIVVTEENGRVVVTVDGDPTPLILEAYEVLQYRKFEDDTIRFCNRERFADLPVAPAVLSDIVINGVVPTTFDELDAALLTLFPAMPSSGGGGGGVESVTGDLVDDTDPLNPVVSLPYKVYTALLSQSGTDAPVATVLQNTLGGTVVWTREGVGDYRATLAGAFTNNKTICPPFDSNGFVSLPLQGATLYDYGYYLARFDSDSVQLGVWNAAYQFTELSDIGNFKLLIEIRVYP